jgi:hypothetical protein
VQPDVVILENDVGVPDVTLRRGVLLDSAPILTAQPVGSSRALVQFDHGDDSPTHLVDFAAGTAQKVAAGAMLLRDSNDRFATVEMDRLYRLDLTTAALDPVEPAAGNSGFAAGGYTFYVAIDGTLSALPTGSQEALALGFTTCRSAVVLAAAEVAAVPGWFSIAIPAGCSQTSASFVLVNPRLQIARGPFTSLFAASGNLFLREPDGGNPSSPTSSLRKVDPATGNETTAIAAVRIVQAINGDSTLLLVGSQSSPGSINVDLKLVDVVAGTVADAASNVSSGGTSFVSEDFRQTGLFIGSALIRYDTRTVTPLCASPSMVSGPTMLSNGTGHPLGFVCSSGSTLRTYEWAIDRVRDLANAATSPAAFTGRIATWNEGSTLRAARIGDGDPAVTLCAGATSGTSLVTSADGSVAALSCPDAGDVTGKMIAVDLRTGAFDTLVAAKPRSGSFINPSSIVVSAAGRGVILDYTTNALASDPASCGSPECTLVIDRRNGTRTFANPAMGLFSATSSPDDRGFAINGSTGPLIALFGAAAPTLVSTTASGLLLGIGADGRHALVGQGGLRGPYSLVDLVSGAATPVTAPSISPTGSPIQLGSTNDFLVAEGMAHVDTGVVESLGASATPICGVFGSRFAFLDGTGMLLEEYAAGSGVRTIAAGVLDLNLGTCADVRRLLLGGFDGSTGSLLGYAPKTGAVTQLAADVSSHIGASGSRMFAFQHPDSVSGDLLLVGSTGTALPLGARAHLGTTFTVAGSRVAFTGGTANEEPKLVAAKLDGSGARTVGPAADRVLFSPDGTRLLFDSGGLLWSEDRSGPAVALGEAGTMGEVVLNGTGDVLLYSVSSGEHRGTYRVDLRRNADVPARETTPLAWALTSL